GLIVQERLPPMPGYELGQHHDDGPSGVAAVNSVDIAQKRRHEGTVRRDDRIDHDPGPDDLLPARLEVPRALRVERDVDGVHVATQTAGDGERAYRGAVDAADRDDDLRDRRPYADGRGGGDEEAVLDRAVVHSDPVEHQHEQRQHDRDEPRTLRELR